MTTDTEKLPIQWRHNAQGCGRKDQHAAGTWRSCASELEQALARDNELSGDYTRDYRAGIEDGYAMCERHYRDRAAQREAVALREDAARLNYIERTFSGMTNRERYLPVQMIWGDGCNGRTLREACDKHMARDAARRGDGK